MSRDAREWTKTLDKLEGLIEEVRLKYQRYFEGLDRREPISDRDKLKKVIRKLSGMYIGNTQLKFRLSAMVARFNSYNNMWERIIAQIDAGTYRPDRFKADLRMGQGQAKRPPSPNKQVGAESRDDGGGIFKDTYDQFIELRKQTGENTRITYEKFSRIIQKQQPALKNKLGGQQVCFRVVIENGKTKLKGFAKK